MNINNFPIPDLPATMLDDVLKKLDTMDLIHYSTSSEFCKNSVKSMLTKRQIKLGIILRGIRHSIVLHHLDVRDCTICIALIKEANLDFRMNYSKKVTMNFNEKSVLAGVRSPKSFLVFWEKKIEGLIFMLDYLTELFPHMPICELDAHGLFKEDNEKFIEWVKKRDKPEVEFCTIREPNTAENVSNIIDNMNITTMLNIFIPLPEDFKCDLPQNLKLFDCKHAKWITRDQLLQMNYEQIDLRETKFQNKDISDLVNRIMNCNLPAIRFCNIELDSSNMDEIVNGINYDKIPSQLRCHLSHPIWRGCWSKVYGVYDYERADGKVVSICSGFPDSITRKIMIFVWSKTEPLELLE